tara:strand:- start:204356 stop:205240 length:885 start_codon:yes stop_codon:yes gene_type:complete
MIHHSISITTFTILLSSLFAGCSTTGHRAADANESIVVQPLSEVQWTPLNPARGDNSPKAGTLWGDRSANTATGFLVEFKEGFSSPPHIHNVSYRGIVISGLIHNDDPNAEHMWMPPGSYWTQPKGEAHITAASGTKNLAYIEIDEGPYLVHPTKQAFDSGERPINIDASNIVWLDASSTNWISSKNSADRSDGPQIAYLWGIPQEQQMSGILLKLPSDFEGKLSANNATAHAVVLQGRVEIRSQSKSQAQSIAMGGSFQSKNGLNIHISNNSEDQSILYIRTDSQLKISSTAH